MLTEIYKFLHLRIFFSDFLHLLLFWTQNYNFLNNVENKIPLIATNLVPENCRIFFLIAIKIIWKEN